MAFRVGAELWIADTATGETRVVPITSVTGQEENELEWSRDGSKIAVAEPARIHVVHVDGRASTVIPVEGDVPRSLGWTAGDGRIIYVSVVPVDEVGMAVHVVDVDGTNDTVVSPQRPTAPGVSISFNEAVVSPDGTRVVYLQSSRQSELKQMAIALIDGSNGVEMSVPAEMASGLQWSPDGKRLLLSSIDGLVSVGLGSGSPAIVYANGTFGAGLNLEWSWSEVTWQPVPK